MKIAMIGQKGIPTLFGGVERHVEKISCFLAREKNYEVFVYTRSYYTPKKIRKFKKVNIIHLPSFRTKHLDAISHVFLASWHAIFKIRADVIHYHGVGPALCLWIPKLFYPRAKIIFTFHCRDYFHKKWGWLAQLCLRTGEIIGCFFADEIIPTDLEVQKYIKRKYNRQTNFIPHGIEQQKYISAKLIKKWGLKKDNYILSVSRLIPHKGIHYLIKAYQEIKTEKRLVIVGPSFYSQDYEKQLKKMARSNSKILFLGVQRWQTLRELYSNAYFFTHPSEHEGAPLVLMEAAGFGLPLLLSNINVHKKTFGDLPFFFKNKNIKDLGEKLKFLLNNPKIVWQRARKIKRYSWSKYNWNKTVEEIILRYT